MFLMGKRLLPGTASTCSDFRPNCVSSGPSLSQSADAALIYPLRFKACGDLAVSNPSLSGSPLERAYVALAATLDFARGGGDWHSLPRWLYRVRIIVDPLTRCRSRVSVRPMGLWTGRPSAYFAMGNAAELSEIGAQISDTGRLLSGLKAHVLDRVSLPAANTVWVPADFSGFTAGEAVNKSLE